MPTERLSMRRIRQVLQLHFGAQASARVIAREVGVGRSTVQDYLARAAAAGLGWPLAPDLTDVAIEQRLFPAPNCNLHQEPCRLCSSLAQMTCCAPLRAWRPAPTQGES